MMEFPLLSYSGFISILSFFSGGKTNDWEGGKRGGGDDLEPLEEMKTIWSRDDFCHRHHKSRCDIFLAEGEKNPDRTGPVHLEIQCVTNIMTWRKERESG